MAPQERLAASNRVYASATTYRDEGTITIGTVVSGKDVPDAVYAFTTAFERGRRFRFQFELNRSPSGVLGTGPANALCTVWSTDNQTFLFLEQPGSAVPKQKVGPSTPLAAATGISWGLADRIIPSLRIDPLATPLVGQLTQPIDAGTETIDGVPCRKIQGDARVPGSIITLWIGADGLVRRVRNEFRGEYVYIFDLKPVLNEQTIDAAHFTPPKH